MEPFIEIQKVRPLLLEIRNQHIQVSFRNEAGKWSEEYFHIEYCEAFPISSDVFLVMVRAPNTDKVLFIDLNSITGIKLNKYLNWKGYLHSSFEIFPSKNLKDLKVPSEDIKPLLT
jgi:hypothetical protein